MTREQLVEVVLAGADRHDDVERAVRLVAARGAGDVGELRRVVDQGLRTRRFLDYREGLAWAQAAHPIVDELSSVADTSPTRELVELLQRRPG